MTKPRDYIEMGPRVFAKDPQSRFPDDVAARIFRRDITLWNGPPEAVGGRLGWLSLPENPAPEAVGSFPSAAPDKKNIRRVILAGMGGAALMSKVFARAFEGRSAARLTVADTTVTDSLLALKREIDFSETLFIVSSKSGATVETASVAEFFFDQCARSEGGADRAAGRFAAITDRGTPLFETAAGRGFARVFEGDETVGGRFSPLSVFGMIPAALAGADTKAILSRALAMSDSLRRDGGGSALRLAAAVDTFCERANGKFHVRCSEGIAGFDRFVEQIVGESLGKDGRRVLPVAHDLCEEEETGGAVFVCLKGDGKTMAIAEKTAERGIPVVATVVDGAEGLGAEVFRWEFAVAILGAKWGVNPFDQPDVEGAKSQTRRFLDIYRSAGELPFSAPDFEDCGIQFRATDPSKNIAEARAALEKAAAERKEGGYLSIQAFLDKEALPAVEFLRSAISKKFGVSVTADLGPAYLHSSGQIHKGGGADGFFIQITAPPAAEDLTVPEGVPDSGGVSFEILKNAQMLGDREALERAGRKVFQAVLPQGGGEAAGGVLKFAELLGLGGGY